MFYIEKVLNNNALLVLNKGENMESIFMGKGIGFGKKVGEIIENHGEIKEYKLVAGDNRSTQIGEQNGIKTEFLESAARIIEEAHQVFDDISDDILLPLAEHIAFAVKRQRDNMLVPNPFIPDIKIIYGKEYAVALKSRDIIRRLTGYEVSDDEAGFIALHIHSGLSHEQVSETLKDTQIINQSMSLIVQRAGKDLDETSLTYTRLLSHVYYMIVRTRIGEKVHVDLNEYMRNTYPKAMKIAEEICSYIAEHLEQEPDLLESGYLAVHVQRYLSE